jgi:sortase A
MGLRSVLRADLYEKMQGKNYLVIPKIGLVKEIFEGNEESILDKGVWIRPVSEHPFRSGNTVLAGHRYTNAFDENVFYDLDKISKGDVIWAKWADSERKYVVSEVKIVSAETVEIESQTSEEILTVYTCEPLYTAEKRMVLIAKPVD